jgi:hypothetical protein
MSEQYDNFMTSATPTWKLDARQRNRWLQANPDVVMLLRAVTMPVRLLERYLSPIRLQLGGSLGEIIDTGCPWEFANALERLRDHSPMMCQ